MPINIHSLCNLISALNYRCNIRTEMANASRKILFIADMNFHRKKR